MNTALALFLLANLVPISGDTLVDLRVGDRLILRDISGSVSVAIWDRDELRVEVGDKGGGSVDIRRSGESLDLRLAVGRQEEARIRLTAPAWLDLSISGKEIEVEIRDLEGDVSLRNLEGDLLLLNLGGKVDAYSAQGTIEASGLTGEGRLRTGDDEISVTESTASLELQTVDGDIILSEMTSRRIQVRTTDGDIEFSGQIQEGGDYGFFSHQGDISLRFHPAPDLDATVMVYGGEFVSDFPVRANGLRAGEELMFSLGSGGARLVAETFDGDVRFLHGGAAIEHRQIERIHEHRLFGGQDEF